MTKPGKIALGVGTAGAACAASAVSIDGVGVVGFVLLMWTAGACGIAAAAYVVNRPGWFGKRSGRLTLRSLPAAPYLAAFHIGCALMRWWRPPDRPSQVAPGVWVSGRVRGGLPPGVTAVVDLTSEFTAPRAVRELPGYRSLPTLDGGVPPDRARCLALLSELADDRAGVLVHCDAGRGRAPTFAAALLVARGVVADVDAGLRLVRERRPVSHPSAVDVAFLRAVDPALRAIARARPADSLSRGGDARRADPCAAPL